MFNLNKSERLIRLETKVDDMDQRISGEIKMLHDDIRSFIEQENNKPIPVYWKPFIAIITMISGIYFGVLKLFIGFFLPGAGK